MSRQKKPNEIIRVTPNRGEMIPSGEAEQNGKGALVAQILQTMDIASRTDQASIESLTAALQEYLQLCMQTNTSVTNKSLYAALGVTDDTINNWINGRSRSGDPRFKEFGLMVKRICAQYRELAAAENKLHPTLTIWWQKNYDGLQDNPLPEKKLSDDFVAPVDPEEIAAKYKHLLTDKSGERMEAEMARRSVHIPVDEEEDEE